MSPDLIAASLSVTAVRGSMTYSTSCETAPRVRVDCDGYRAKAESRLVQSAVEKAQRVLAGGNSITLPPMNAYHRRLVHSALAEIPGVSTHSEEGDSRFKRIVISPSS